MPSADKEEFFMELFHITSQLNLGSILKHGLRGCWDEAIEDTIPGWDEGVNLTSSLDDFFRPIGDREIALVIDCTRLDPARLKLIGDWWWRYSGDLPRQAIIRAEQGGEVLHINHREAA
jgi:hypothetical protein